MKIYVSHCYSLGEVKQINPFIGSRGKCPVQARIGDVAGAVQGTWNSAKSQIKTIVDNVVFPVIDVILAILLFVKLALSYMDYRKHGQFEWTAPAILFGCLLFSLTAPLYVWNIVGM